MHEIFSKSIEEGFLQKDDPRIRPVRAECWYHASLISKNNNEIIDFLQEAASLGHTEAMNLLGIHYFTDKGLDKDLSKAYTFFSKSAELNNAFGLYRLGWLYHVGDFVEKNETRAKELWILAAKLNNKNAIDNLKAIYNFDFLPGQ